MKTTQPNIDYTAQGDGHNFTQEACASTEETMSRKFWGEEAKLILQPVSKFRKTDKQ